MRTSLLNDLVCPGCGGCLDLQVCSESWDGSRVHTGVLSCACGEQYPIIKGVPRMLLGSLRNILLDDYPRFFSVFGHWLKDDWYACTDAGGAARAKRCTAASFGFEWSYFQRMLPVYRDNFRWYTEPLGAVHWRGLHVLDAGCGTGRHVYHMASQGANVVAVDLSRAIDVAVRNTSHFSTIDFVQADITALPLRGRDFDIVLSLGVLHHLPEPEKGFDSLAAILKPDGHLLIYVYWDLAGEPPWLRTLLRLVNSVRPITTQMSFERLKLFSLLFAAFCYLYIVLPGKALRRTELGQALPLSFYKDYPLRVLANDTFDRFSAPIENRYDSQSVSRWFAAAGFADVRVLGGAGWRAAGRLTHDRL
jgi:SAM-dependent methyltransferase